MATAKRTLRTCKKGHKYYKSTDCPTCPTCEKEKKPSDGFLSRLSSPARSALLHYLDIDTVEKLSMYTEKEILKLHGMGKASMPILRKALEEKGLRFKEEDEAAKR
ncbi:RNA polymerase alpha subunit C-terminal domain-containing protein [Negadavirga shengliensis]|uniref:RNA polymerase alpha subunit C-terminal domain-containing protein n=1 Tax=Negadavirga shengliensis TaxID=1389218 RepID=A0ABV9T8J2_9BACT